MSAPALVSLVTIVRCRPASSAGAKSVSCAAARGRAPGPLTNLDSHCASAPGAVPGAATVFKGGVSFGAAVAPAVSSPLRSRAHHHPARSKNRTSIAPMEIERLRFSMLASWNHEHAIVPTSSIPRILPPPDQGAAHTVLAAPASHGRDRSKDTLHQSKQDLKAERASCWPYRCLEIETRAASLRFQLIDSTTRSLLAPGLQSSKVPGQRAPPARELP